MKKIITLTFAITVLMLGAIGIQAQPNNKYPSKIKTNYSGSNGSHNRGGIKKPGIRTFYTTEYVWKRGKQYKNTYEITILRNGRTIKALVKSIKVMKNQKVKTYYQVETIKQGRKTYRVTYKITKYARGKVVKQVVKKVLIHVKNHRKHRKHF